MTVFSLVSCSSSGLVGEPDETIGAKLFDAALLTKCGVEGP